MPDSSGPHADHLSTAHLRLIRQMIRTGLLGFAYTTLPSADVLHHATVEHWPLLMVDHLQFCEHRQYLAFFQWLGAGRIGSFVDVPVQAALADQKAAWF
jgi:hypothetical protein